MAEEDDIASISIAYRVLARAKPASAQFVAHAIPPKVANFLIGRRGLDSGRFDTWSTKHPEWTDTIVNAVREPDCFVRVIEDMAEQVKRH